MAFKSGRGGQREGAGRKGIGRKKIFGATLSQKQWEWIDMQKGDQSYSAFLRNWIDSEIEKEELEEKRKAESIFERPEEQEPKEMKDNGW